MAAALPAHAQRYFAAPPLELSTSVPVGPDCGPCERAGAEPVVTPWFSLVGVTSRTPGATGGLVLESAILLVGAGAFAALSWVAGVDCEAVFAASFGFIELLFKP